MLDQAVSMGVRFSQLFSYSSSLNASQIAHIDTCSQPSQTTIAAFTYDGGVVMAADSRTSTGERRSAASLNLRHLRSADGSAATAQELSNTMQNADASLVDFPCACRLVRCQQSLGQD